MVSNNISKLVIYVLSSMNSARKSRIAAERGGLVGLIYLRQRRGRFCVRPRLAVSFVTQRGLP